MFRQLAYLIGGIIKNIYNQENNPAVNISIFNYIEQYSLTSHCEEVTHRHARTHTHIRARAHIQVYIYNIYNKPNLKEYNPLKYGKIILINKDKNNRNTGAK